jgi:hypothetical protein
MLNGLERLEEFVSLFKLGDAAQSQRLQRTGDLIGPGLGLGYRQFSDVLT